MANQIFISYRRNGGDATAKLICDKLKERGFTVFYDHDSLCGGYFDSSIFKAIEECDHFVLILSPHALDRCVDEKDWVRMEICHALKNKKNIVLVLLPRFVFPSEMPSEIEEVSRLDGVRFPEMEYLEAAIDRIISRFDSSPQASELTTVSNISTSEVFERLVGAKEELVFNWCENKRGYVVSIGDCTKTEIVIPRLYKGKDVTAIGEGAFAKCTFLKSIVIPDSVSYIGRAAFFECASLENITIPNSVKTIEEEAFARCVRLSKITIPNGVKRINRWTFAGCVSLANIDISNSVKCIGIEAFYMCVSLSNIMIPSSVISLLGRIFSGCNRLVSIRYSGTVKQWGEIEKSLAFLKESKVVQIHCIDGTIEIK